MKFRVFMLVLAILILPSVYSQAQVPKMINYQGKITKPGGALVDTTTSMVFSIYSDSTGGTALWTETQSSVKVEYGVFSVLLGSVNPIPGTVFDGNARYLGLKVGNDFEMTPRKAIVSVGYAYHSGTADTAHFAMLSPSFGNWESKNANVTYQTATDGFIVAYTDQCECYFEILTDSSNPPTTIRLIHSDYGGPGWKSGMCPVRKNDYWVVNLYQGGMAIVYWIPFGN